MNEQTEQVAAVLRFRKLVELIADPDERWYYRNGEAMAPDAAAFLEYVRGVEQRLVAAEEALTEAHIRESKLRAQLRWRVMTERPPRDGSYPYVTFNGTHDNATYSRAEGWHMARPRYMAAWFLLPLSPFDEQPDEEAEDEDHE